MTHLTSHTKDTVKAACGQIASFMLLQVAWTFLTVVNAKLLHRIFNIYVVSHDVNLMSAYGLFLHTFGTSVCGSIDTEEGGEASLKALSKVKKDIETITIMNRQRLLFHLATMQ